MMLCLLSTAAPNRDEIRSFCLMNEVDFVMTEHAAWTPAVDGAGKLRVFVTPDGGRWLVRAHGPAFTLHELTPAANKPVYDVFSLPPGVLGEVPELAAALAQLGRVARFRTGNLWEAIGTAVIRQVVRAAQAKTLYRDFCQAYGEPLDLPTGGRYWLFPTPEDVLDLSSEQFRAAGLAFKRVVLRDAATCYLRFGQCWQELSPQALIDQLQQVPRVGPWTAHAAATDGSNDWALYPYGDLAVRTWARRAAPSYPWPTDERTFGNTWRMLTRTHLSLATVLTLAWGNHHGDTG
jgi:DNA-3-methyladenine glycosylase II